MFTNCFSRCFERDVSNAMFRTRCFERDVSNAMFRTRCFERDVSNRRATTLLPIIQGSIRPGTTIMSDMWTAYGGIQAMGYAHLTVNHTYEFVDPITGAHTQNVENSWKNAKQQKISKCLRWRTCCSDEFGAQLYWQESSMKYSSHIGALVVEKVRIYHDIGYILVICEYLQHKILECLRRRAKPTDAFAAAY